MGIITGLRNDYELDADIYDDHETYVDSISYCKHGNESDNCDACDACDDYERSRGGIDKCMNCGRYKYNDELTYPGQTCIKGCVNPNEY